MLNKEKNILVESLRQAVLSGDANAIAQIQNEIAGLQPQVIGEKAAKLKTNIDETASRLKELEIETRMLESVRGKRNKTLAQTICEYQQALIAVQKVDAALYACDSEAENLREFKRRCVRELAELSESMAKQFTGDYI